MSGKQDSILTMIQLLTVTNAKTCQAPVDIQQIEKQMPALHLKMATSGRMFSTVTQVGRNQA